MEGLKVPQVCFKISPGIPEMKTGSVFRDKDEMWEGYDYSLRYDCLRLLHSHYVDSGKYTIVVVNCLGNSSASFHLNITRSTLPLQPLIDHAITI